MSFSSAEKKKKNVWQCDKENQDEKVINVCTYEYTVLFSFRLCCLLRHLLFAVRFLQNAHGLISMQCGEPVVFVCVVRRCDIYIYKYSL